MLINWHDSYSIHNALIDEQHKKLFDLAKKAYLMGNKFTSREEIKGILAEFFDYMKVHFTAEEEYMASIGYPLLDDHKGLHKHIIQELSIAIVNIKNVNDMKEKLGVIAQEWLLNHILYQDMLIEKYRARSLVESENTAKIVEKTAPQENTIATEAAEEKKKEGYYYACGCENKTHVIPESVHLKIQQSKSVYRCKVCSQAIVFTGQSHI